MVEPMTCTQCGVEVSEGEIYHFDEEDLCVDCYEEETIACSRCGERILNDDNSRNDHTPLCERCYEYHYTHCDRCGCLLSNDDVYYIDENSDNDSLCYGCYENAARHARIHSYSYKPEPIFHGEGTRYFGIELEIDDAGKDEDNAEKLCKLVNRHNDNIYIKADSSLDDGLEIVTHPMTLEYHIKSMPWKSLLNRASELGYKSHMADTCGLHIHVNRDSFSDNYDYQEECIARVLYLVERFWTELLRFSRRTQSQLKRWANRYGYKDKPAEILDSAKKGYGGRYTCVNLVNYSTIEFRIFRGTLKYNTLIATLQLVNEICNVAVSLSDEAIANLGWCDFMESISPIDYPELITYLKEHRLYINEPVVCETEV